MDETYATEQLEGRARKHGQEEDATPRRAHVGTGARRAPMSVEMMFLREKPGRRDGVGDGSRRLTGAVVKVVRTARTYRSCQHDHCQRLQARKILMFCLCSNISLPTAFSWAGYKHTIHYSHSTRTLHTYRHVVSKQQQCLYPGKLSTTKVRRVTMLFPSALCYLLVNKVPYPIQKPVLEYRCRYIANIMDIFSRYINPNACTSSTDRGY